jgi:hypothetical protein
MAPSSKHPPTEGKSNQPRDFAERNRQVADLMGAEIVEKERASEATSECLSNLRSVLMDLEG